MQDEWLTNRLAYLKGLKSPNDQQRLLILLTEKSEQSKEDSRKINALVSAEKAAERSLKARANAARIVSADKVAIRKARDHELYQVAGLLSLAGLVDKLTGKPLTVTDVFRFPTTASPSAVRAALSAIPEQDLTRDAHGDPDWRRAVTLTLAEQIRAELA